MWRLASILDSTALGHLHLKITHSRREESCARYCRHNLRLFFLMYSEGVYSLILVAGTGQRWEDFLLHLKYTMEPPSVIYREGEGDCQWANCHPVPPHSRFKRLTFLFFLLSPFFFKHPPLVINQISLFSKYLPPKRNLQFNLLYKIIYWLINLITKLQHSPWYSRQF